MKNRKLLMIPGPIEFEPEVLRTMSVQTASHVAPNFIECFGTCLDLMLKIWQAPKGQPFIVAGSGTLAMDMAACNLIEANDNALVVSTGYFGNRFQDILNRYGANTTILESEVGKTVDLALIEKELQSKPYKLLTFTHVDTSTGVLVAPKEIAALCHKYNVLCVLDGVCSVAAEEIQQEAWGIDVVLTASQKAIGVPPGLALLVVSEKAIQVWKNRKTPVSNYYGDFANWLPIMQAYQERRPSYFGTPPVNLIAALEVGLNQIDLEGIENRVKRHQKYASAFRSAMNALALSIIPQSNEYAANTLSAVYYPEGVDGGDFTKAIGKQGVIVAGGLHPDFKAKYFRVGHMGAVTVSDIAATINAIELTLKESNYPFEFGKGISAFQKAIV